MKPHNVSRKGRGAEAAASVYLRTRLGWLRGFPFAEPEKGQLTWISLPRLGPQAQRENIQVTRDLLRRTQFGWNSAKRKFPRALVRVVGDVDAWSLRTNIQLELLKGVVHFGQALPELEQLLEARHSRRSTILRVAKLVKRRSALRPLLTGLVWIHWHDEPGFLMALDAIQAHVTAIERLLARLAAPTGLVVVLRCIQLLVEDGSSSALIDVLSDWRCWETPLSDGDQSQRLLQTLKKLRSGHEILKSVLTEGFDRPTPQLGRDLLEFIRGLATSRAMMRTRQLQLFQVLAIEETLSAWQRWWENVENYRRKVRGLLDAPQIRLTRKDKERCRDLGEEIRNALRAPQSFRWRQISDLVNIVCAASSPGAFENLVGCLRLLSGDSKGRSLKEIFLEQWVGALRTPARGRPVIEQLLAAQRGVLERLQTSYPERHAWICRYVTMEMINSWISEAKPHRLIEPTMQALSQLVANAGSWEPDHFIWWEALIAAVEITGDAETAAAAVARVPPTGRGLRGAAWIALLRLSQASAERFHALANGWRARQWTGPAKKELTFLAKIPNIAELLAQGFASGDGKRLSRLLARSALVRALGRPVDCQLSQGPEATIDLTPYPLELHGVLQDLARCDPDAAYAADQILSQDYPLPTRLEAELAFLRNLMEQENNDRRQELEARVRKLEKHLQTPSRASASRLDKYRTKLESRIRHAQLLIWEQQVDAELRTGLEQKIGVLPPEGWLECEEILAVLTGLVELPTGFRELAFLLLRVRCGPEPWDLRDEPANRGFLARLQQRGRRIEPWLEGIGPREVTVDSQRLLIEFENDPLQIMRMGQPFETCLAPGAINFFSAIANAADINKRVVYARDLKGVIRARCLLALTDEGNVVSFNIYAHSHYQAIKNAITAFVCEVAHAMRSTVSVQGQVRNLISTDWYDDGSIDLTNQLGFLKPPSKFLKLLETVAVNDLVPALKQCVADSEIRPSVILALSRTQQFRKRPELILPLLPYIDASANLDVWSRISLVTISRMAGHANKALELLDPLPHAVLAADGANSWIQVEVARELVELQQPHRALRLIRQSRSPRVREWSDEPEDRIFIAARALEELYRPRKALELYRIVSNAGPTYYLSREARERAEALEAQLGLSPRPKHCDLSPQPEASFRN